MMVRNFFAVLAIVIFSMVSARQVAAHPTQPRVEISAERVNPGGVLDIRGVAFDYEEFVTLYLERKGIVVQLGETHADLEGIFLYTAVLPVDLPQGDYSIRAITSHHNILSPTLTVQGSAILEGGGQGPREEDDALLAPMPTYAPGVVPGGVVQTTPAAQPVMQPTSLFPVSPIILLGLSVFVILAVFFVFRRRAIDRE